MNWIRQWQCVNNSLAVMTEAIFGTFRHHLDMDGAAFFAQHAFQVAVHVYRQVLVT